MKDRYIVEWYQVLQLWKSWTHNKQMLPQRKNRFYS